MSSVYSLFDYHPGYWRWGKFWSIPRGSTCSERKEGKEEYLYSAIYTAHSRKALRHGSHSFTCKLHHARLSFVSVYQMAPPLTEVADIQLQLTTHLLTPKGWKADLAGWLTYSGQFTHISGHASATGRAQDRESTPAEDRRSTAVPSSQQTANFHQSHNQNTCRQKNWVGNQWIQFDIEVVAERSWKARSLTVNEERCVQLSWC